ATGAWIVGQAGRAEAMVTVNDRADLARLSGAAGVRVGQRDLSPSAARMILGEGALIGLSTHTRQQIDAALSEPISYLAIGPVFGSSTKVTGYDPVGLERVRDAARSSRAAGRPVVAIGGITLDSARARLLAGAAPPAGVGALFSTRDPPGRRAG